MIDNVIVPYALRSNKSRIFNKIKPCKPIRIPVVKADCNNIKKKSPGPSNSSSFQVALFTRTRTPKKAMVPKIKDLTDDFKKKIENIRARDFRSSQSLSSLIINKSAVIPYQFSQRIIKKEPRPPSQIVERPLLCLAQVRKSIRNAIQSLSPDTNKNRMLVEQQRLSLSPLSRHMILKSLH